MIKLIDRYIMGSILNMTLLIFFIFIGLMILIGLSGEIPVLRESYTMWRAVQYVFLKIPMDLYTMFPTIALLGSLLGLGTLASHSELTVMRAGGMSIFRLSLPVFLVALFLTSLAMIGGEYFAPAMLFQAEKNKVYFKKNGQVLSTEQGLWLRQDRAFIRIGTSYDRQRLSDITRYELSDDFKLVKIRHADSAELHGHEWLMHNVVTSDLNFERVIVTTEASALWQLNIDLSDMDISPDRLSLVKVYEQAQLRAANGINANLFWISFWNRIFQPITTLIIVFLAIPFAFGPLRSAAVGLRLLSGVMIGLSFYLFNRFFGPFVAAYQLPPILAALIPMGLFSGLMFFLMLRKQ